MTTHLTFAAIATLAAVPFIAHAAGVRTVALSGQAAPGTPVGVNFTGFNPFYFSLNESGQAAFIGNLAGSGVGQSNDVGVWSEGSGSLTLVARRQSQAPGMDGGFTYRSFASPVLNDAGQTAFWADLLDSGFRRNGSGIWSDRSGDVALVVGAGSPAPGTASGATFTEFGWRGASNNSGQTAFVGFFASGASQGIWSEGSGSLMLVALEGSQAPGLPTGVNFDAPFFAPVLNNAGDTAFTTYDSDGLGVWSDRSGRLALVAHSGSQAPNLPSGMDFGSFSDPALNSAGQIAFSAYLEGDGDGALDDGIWSEGSGSLALVARRGSQAPGTPVGVNFGYEQLVTFDNPLLNDAGQVAFRALISGDGVDADNNEGLWLGGADRLALVARSGDHAPGTPSGVDFETFFPWHGALHLNAAGQIAFTAFLSGDIVPFGNDTGIWATDRTGALQLITRTGDPLEVAPGDFRTIREVSFVNEGTGNGDGLPSGFNNRGQLAFWASFEGGSQGIFVSNRVAVPEPASLPLLAIGLPFLFRGSRINLHRTKGTIV